MDRLCTPHRPIEAGGEQFAFCDSSLSEPRFADTVALPAAGAARLEKFSQLAGAGNIRGSGIYRAAGWTQVGATKGYRRLGAGYSARTESVNVQCNAMLGKF